MHHSYNNFLLIALLGGVLFGCSGYHFRNPQGPLAKYEIHTLKVPMFLNRSVIPNVSGPLTKHFTLVMAQFPDLEIKQFGPTDAILIGIIESALDMRKAVVAGNERIVINDHSANPWRNFNSIGKRRKFWIPDTMTMHLQLRIVLIKDPSTQDIELIKSPMAEHANKHPKIIFNRVIALDRPYTNEIYDLSLGNSSQSHPDARGSLNFIQTAGNRDYALKSMAQEAAYTFKESILYAF